MRRRQKVLAGLPATVNVPTGNVRVLSGADAPVSNGRLSEGDASAGYDIHDGDGGILESHVASRSDALRRMGLFAFHGASLPLFLYGPDGRPTGDRLP
jgi:hypothetical protein